MEMIKTTVPGDRLSEVLNRCGFSDAMAADFVGSSIRTVKRWKAEGCPAGYYRLLQFRAGDLSVYGDQWSGYYVGKDGLMYGPECPYGMTPAELWLLKQYPAMVRVLERERDQLKVELSELRQKQPKTAEIINFNDYRSNNNDIA